MTIESRRSAAWLLIILPTVIYGGVSILRLLIRDPRYRANPLRQQLWRAGHAHAGVLLIVALLSLLYVDQTTLSSGWKQVVRLTIPSAAVFLPVAFFLSVVSPTASKPNRLINLAYVGAVALAVGLFVLGVGLL